MVEVLAVELAWTDQARVAREDRCGREGVRSPSLSLTPSYRRIWVDGNCLHEREAWTIHGR